MSAKQEFRLLSKVVETGEFAPTTKFKVTAESFSDDSAREVYVLIRNHYLKHGEVPSLSLIREVFPEFKTIVVKDSVASLCDVLKQAQLGHELFDLNSIVRSSVADPATALSELQKKVTSISANFRQSTGVDGVASASEIATRYQRVRDAGGVVGVPWPWPALNEATLGARGGSYMVIFSQPKSYKTWLMCACAVHAHRSSHRMFPERNHRVLFLSQEMPKEEIHDRAGALYGQVNWGSMYGGRLAEEEEVALWDGLEKFGDSPEGSFQIEYLSATGLGAVAELDGLIEQYLPDIVFLDGVYLLANREWQLMGTVNAELKRLAMRRDIPIIGSAQESNEGRISFKTFEQDCDALLNIQSEDEQKRNHEVIITAPFMRQSVLRPFAIHTKPAVDFSQKRIEPEYSTDPGADLLDDDDEDPKVQ